ncbi:23S rRNA pseudouridine(2604) synthase RluF [Chitinophaga rhizophila]|uniref:Pseudouridine synthase n=1 Tax=Chitinophaga rhizophila TaxID=2866212 RepID=A0ABS7G7E1_9BACT|nr:23S rRNA pseudouridine(2604) synthase RluF [Chitinophaga rhizophila]MBW8683326.1 23S rRNA pseudouridine(2604) synthase RluF [Chitinophaga rhizophila]
MDQSISLNKFISDTGYCSRREADNLITQGRVLLNDRKAVLGNRYKPGDTVEVDGSLITAAKKEKRVYLALNKPPGITTTTELHVKDNIISFVGYPQRIFPIGRLDKDSEGLIFLTNDGDIINKILRAANNHEKEYVVRVNKPINTTFLQQMSQGVPILDTVTLPCKVQMVGRQTFRIILTQGLNRQIRRMCEYLGYAVVGLQRVRIMNVKLDKLPLGKWRYLTDAEMASLKESIADSSGESDKVKPAAKRRNVAAPATADKTQQAAPAPRNRPADHRQKHKAAKPGTKEPQPAVGGKNRTAEFHQKHASAKPTAKDHTPKKGQSTDKPGKKEHATQKSAPARKGRATGQVKKTGKGRSR